MKTLFYLIPLLAFSLPLQADDIFHLHDETKLEGSIVEDLGHSYKLRVKISRSIYDEKIIPKADIKKIIKEDPSKKAFENIQTLTPTPNLLSAEEYLERLQLVEEFLLQHPNSSFQKTAQTIQEQLKKEHQQVVEGGQKFNDQFYSAQEITNNQYEYDAMVELAQFSKHLKKAQYLQASEILHKLYNTYRYTQPTKEALEKGSVYLPKFIKEVEEMIKEAPEKMKAREKKIANLSPSLRKRTQAHLEQLEEKYLARVNEAKKNDLTFLPLSEDHPDIAQKVLYSLRKFNTLITRELSRKTDADSGEVYRKALQALESENIDESASEIKQLKRQKLPSEYLTPLEERYNLLRKSR